MVIALRIKVRTVQISLLASNGKACADRMTALLLIAYCYKSQELSLGCCRPYILKIEKIAIAPCEKFCMKLQYCLHIHTELL
ncbi:MAG: hypothetical protein F6J93_05415 [Oscillatoria sp. SIO1A7]|nr:hypothetical protein [Oscillatoria sp. SIO1A7]